MGMVGRLSHQALVSRRRTQRRKPLQIRRLHHWPDGGLHRPAAASESAPVGAPAWPAAVVPDLPAAPESPVQAPPAVGSAVPAEPSVLDMPLNTLRWSEPLRWLALGWRDFRRAPLIGLFYGACFVLMGWGLLAVFQYAPAYTLALSAGFLLMGPFLCLGLYQASRRMDEGEHPDFQDSLTAWRHNKGQLAVFATVLLVLEMLWGRAAMIVFAVSFDGMAEFDGTLTSLLTVDNIPFLVTYVAVGGIFAGLIYAVSVISMPMMLHRSVDAISAGLASMRLFTTQMGVMLWWGALITGVVVLAMLPGFLGLLVAGPVLGHASWHAYRAATEVRAGERDR
ncbi:DUF2189 domain-containing protein [uncultured Aquabacterium sp.]|uniref:DUF2189 domain-containing protein n=1 Tax=Aquabacterium sp. TaxID=1872578 RepID=UPI0025EC1D34|nr:DUF2189 domain-containing protein [uncultured Aquabacterium sp.]